jgi:ubiquinone/menaquinone biosynthesis C-methylase UbiE
MRIVNAAPNRLAIDALDLRPGQSILEIGCGPGLALQSMARQVPAIELYGVDHSPVMIAQAAARNRTMVAQGRLHLVEGTWAELPWPDRSFDRILMVNVAYFFRAGGADLREARRVLRPDGKLVAYATHRRSMRNWRFADEASHRLLDPSDFACDLRSAGFAADMISSTDVLLPFGLAGFVVTARRPPEGRA